jgi:hypothetical protein
MRALIHTTLGTIAGFLVGVCLAYGGVELLSGNVHDRSMEAVMTAFFAAGPAGAIIGAAVGLGLSRRSESRRAA